MTGKKETYNKITDYINRSRNILITGHEEPDGDSIGSQLALAHHIKSLGKQTTIVNRGIIPAKYRFMPESDSIMDPSRSKTKLIFDLAVFVDCPRMERTGGIMPMITDDIPVINIDHHPDNALYGTINLVDPSLSSVGEILYEYFESSEMIIDRVMAIALYVAIITDTGRFRYKSTTRRTMEVAGRLIDFGADPREICDKIYYSILPGTLKMTGQVLSGIKFYEHGKICLLRMNHSILIENNVDIGETDGLTDYSLFGDGVMVGALLKEINPARTKVSLRSRDGIDVSLLARKFGGGGHRNAAGFSMELSLKGTEDKVLHELRGLINA